MVRDGLPIPRTPTRLDGPGGSLESSADGNTGPARRITLKNLVRLRAEHAHPFRRRSDASLDRKMFEAGRCRVREQPVPRRALIKRVRQGEPRDAVLFDDDSWSNQFDGEHIACGDSARVTAELDQRARLFFEDLNISVEAAREEEVVGVCRAKDYALRAPAVHVVKLDADVRIRDASVQHRRAIAVAGRRGHVSLIAASAPRPDEGRPGLPRLRTGQRAGRVRRKE